jgi:hypothetical protein
LLFAEGQLFGCCKIRCDVGARKPARDQIQDRTSRNDRSRC